MNFLEVMGAIFCVVIVCAVVLMVVACRSAPVEPPDGAE